MSSPRPETISISDEISSPVIALASTGSEPAAASRSSSKRGTRSSVCGSSTANSSSRPTVRSVEAAKISSVLSRSIGMAKAAAGSYVR